MQYYKVIDEQGKLKLIGTESSLSDGHIGISKEEYDTLLDEIRVNAENAALLEQSIE